MNRRKAKILFMSLCLMICMVLFVSNNTNAASKKPTKMTLNVSKKTVDVGGTYQIKVKSVSPSKASKSVAYKSSNTKIATISSKGIIKGKKEGTAKITVQSKKNKKLKKTVAITVKRLKPYSLTLNKTKLNMNVNDTYKLKATVKASSPITWNSSNKAVVSVDKNGIITAKKDGTVTITVKTTKKGYNGKVLSKSCIVTVSKKDDSSDEPTIDPSKPDTPTPSRPEEPKENVSLVYSCLYSDGELVISQTEITPQKGRTVLANNKIRTPSKVYKDKSKIKKVTFKGAVKPTSCQQWFFDCENLTTINHMENLYTNTTDDMTSMFENCTSLKKIDLSNFETKNVYYMNDMFMNCSSLKTIDTSKFNTAKVKDMQFMFYNCSSLQTLDVSNFNTSNVTDMTNMFYNCKLLKNINLTNFDTSKVTDFSMMFLGCSNFTTLNLSSFDTSKAWDMAWMFRDCTKLKTITASDKWVTGTANTNGMFLNCGTNHVTKI